MSWVLWSMVAALTALGLTCVLVFGGLALVDATTAGLRYFGRPLAERRAMRARVARLGRCIAPMARLLAALIRIRRMPSTQYRGVCAPPPCSRRHFVACERFAPDARDVFVATAPKCGTTWMQQIVYEVLSRGAGDLSDDGHHHIQAASTWLESGHGAPLAQAPRVGERSMRIIKTHLPTKLCPYADGANYIYVTRHPVAAFASLCDFVHKIIGPLAPPPATLVDWYCSDRAWFRPWPEHVDGWWRWSQSLHNVLFLHYEELLDDLPRAVAKVSRFLHVPLTPAETSAVIAKSGFAYMKRNEHCFEMAPPRLFSELADAPSFMVSGQRSRQAGVGETERSRIARYCSEQLRGSSYPLTWYYPDLIANQDFNTVRVPRGRRQRVGA